MKIASIPGCLVSCLILMSVGSGCVADEPGAHRIVPKDPGRIGAAEERGTPEGNGEGGPVELGRALFVGKGICFSCHGPDGSGTQIAPDLTDDEWLHIDEPITVEKIAEIIEQGVSDPIEHPGMMPPRGGAQITDEEIEQLAAYVMALRH